MDLEPKILFGSVMHKRIFPKVNSFNYKIYYISLPLSKINKKLENKYFKFNRFGLLSFYNKDHGNRDGSDLNNWARNILDSHNIDKANGEIILVTMPRVFGYVFNPVSFWYCYDQQKILRAVICEVNNTFGETHIYICAHADQSEIKHDDILEGQKVFHVSPFLEREGHYAFRFSIDNKKMGAWINFFDADGKKKLLTSVTGTFENLTLSSSSRAFWAYPLITFKAIYLIHWQAVKLLLKKTEYIPKPTQMKARVTKTDTKQDTH